MKRHILGVVLFWLIFFCTSTLWAQKVYKPSNQNDNIIGSVQTTFEAIAGLGSKVNEAAYIALLEMAKKEYQGNIDIRDITWVMGKKAKGYGMYEFSSNGKVISLGGGKKAEIKGIEGAVNKICESLIYDLPKNKTIAVLSVSSKDRNTATFVVEELEFQLVNSKEFKIVDRATLDKIRTEQNFQLSGEVDDRSAVSIGKLLGANIVITGSISDSSTSQRITIKALDVQTAQIITMARESF
jgi:TolB-like protein